jgi:hypothetical protein
VTTLPWDARCTAAGHGYVCVGGENHGNFAAIKVAGFPPTDSAPGDAPLPLDLSSRAPGPRPPLLGTAHRIRLEKIGEDIVNSISIHKLPAEGNGEDEVVAVLTNNDQTVRIYSLTHNLEVAVLDLPFPINHATISPNGDMLVAVGDHLLAFFFERVHTSAQSTMKTAEGRTPPLSSEWMLLESVRLYAPPGAGSEGYFTTAWSPSGRLCAAGSECGYITVLDMEFLKTCENGEGAIVRQICSSRPDVGTGPGAVRTMQFSPAPWDFLIWSEDQARVCVADIRSGLVVRQVLALDPKEDGLDKTEIADFDLTISPELQREADFIRRYRRALDSEGTAAAVNFATDYIEASSERRRLQRQPGVVESDNDPHGLTAQERQILEALRTTRQRWEGGEATITPRSINYTVAEASRHRGTSTDLFTSLRNEVRSRDRDAAARQNMADTLTEYMSESARQLNQLNQLQESQRARQADQMNQLQETHRARRRTSVMLSSEGTSSNVEVFGNITDAPTTRSPNPVPAHARRADPEIVASTDNAWRTIEEALARNPRVSESARATAAPELRTELRRLRQLTQMRERLRNARGTQPLDPYSLVGPESGYRRASRSLHDPAHGVRTAGLAMSPDGRTLYCGTEEGIFEFHINLHGRMSFPAITPR